MHGRLRLGHPAGQPEHLRLAQQRVPAKVERVGGPDEDVGLAYEPERGGHVALSRDALGPHAAPEQLRVDVLGAGRFLADAREPLGLLVPALDVDRLREDAGDGREEVHFADRGQRLVTTAQLLLGDGRLALQQERPTVGLGQTAGQPHPERDLLQQGPGPAEELARLVEAPEVRLETGLREQRGRHGLAVALGAVEDLPAAPDPLPRGGGADPHRGRDPRQTLHRLPAVSGPLGVLDRPRPGFLGRRQARAQHPDQAQERPCPGQPALVPEPAEGGDGAPRLPLRLGGPTLGVREQADPQADDDRMRLKAHIRRLGGGLLHLPGDGDEPVEVRRLHERERDLGQQLQASLVVGGQERGGAREEVDGGRHVAARERALAGRRQPLRRALAQRRGPIAGRPELEQGAMRLLEVVADDLLVLPGEVARVHLDPIREPLVHLRAHRLWDPVVGSIADEDVGEAKGILAADLGTIGPDELLAHERLEGCPDPRADLRG